MQTLCMNNTYHSAINQADLSSKIANLHAQASTQRLISSVQTPERDHQIWQGLRQTVMALLQVHVARPTA
jgi:hypothetical protein